MFGFVAEYVFDVVVDDDDDDDDDDDISNPVFVTFGLNLQLVWVILPLECILCFLERLVRFPET